MLSRAEEIANHITRESIFPATARRLHDAGSMLAHRLRQRSNIEPALGERLVFAWFFADGISLRKAEESDIMTIDTIWVVHFQRNYRADPEASQRFGQRRANVVWVIPADNGYVPNVLYLGF